jgi:PD-(D/E)XK nuclease superfamily protein
MTTLTQGGESVFNGRWLEQVVELEFKNRGFPIVDYAVDLGNGHLFLTAMAVRRVPYTSIYGCQSVSEFVLYYRGRAIRIECRVQETAGSVDEKFPYLLMNARDRMPEREVILLMHGEGARSEAVDWLRRGCRAATDVKSILVMDVSEFRKWLRDLIKD